MTDMPSPEQAQRVTRALAMLDGMADLWFAQSGFDKLDWPPPIVRAVKQAHVEGLYTGRCSAVDETAMPVDRWIKVIDEPVLLYVVHVNAKFEEDAAEREEKWEGWHVGSWTDFNGGGWVWHGLCGAITHVAPLPKRPEWRR